MTMITIQKLPSLEPEMRGALRKHIMRKRQRLKQEMEQDAIEKRLKKEREQKRIQDAMTLDQIKEQLSTLEKRLESLRNEKHDLFVQLKQVLNEGSSKRKQSDPTPTTSVSSDQQKKQKLEDVASSNPTSSSITKNDNDPPGNKQSSAIVNQEQEAKQEGFVQPEKPQELVRPRIQSPKQIPTLSPRSQTGTASFDSKLPRNPMAPFGRQIPIIGMSSVLNHDHVKLSPYKYPESPASLQRHESLPLMSSSSAAMSPQNLVALQAQFRTSLGGASSDGLPSIPPELLLMSQRLNQNFQKLPPLGPQKYGLNSMSLPPSLSQGQHELLNSSKPLGLALNAQHSDEILPGLSKAHGLGMPGSPFQGHPNQFFLDNALPPHLAHLNLLNHGIPLSALDPSTSIATSIAGLVPNMANFDSRSPLSNQLPRSGLDYLGHNGQQLRPNLLLPGFSSLYPPHSSPSMQPSTSLYSGADFNHALFQASLAQRMGGPMAPFNLTPQQQQQLQQSQLEQASRMFANNPANFHRRSSPKSQFYPGR